MKQFCSSLLISCPLAALLIFASNKLGAVEPYTMSEVNYLKLSLAQKTQEVLQLKYNVMQSEMFKAEQEYKATAAQLTDIKKTVCGEAKIPVDECTITDKTVTKTPKQPEAKK